MKIHIMSKKGGCTNICVTCYCTIVIVPTYTCPCCFIYRFYMFSVFINMKSYKLLIFLGRNTTMYVYLIYINWLPVGQAKFCHLLCINNKIHRINTLEYIKFLVLSKSTQTCVCTSLLCCLRMYIANIFQFKLSIMK